jgi:acyl-CoA thioester hydrolase
VICIVTALVGYGDSHLDVEMLMYDKEQQILKAILWTKFTHINSRTGKRDQLNGEVMEWVNKALISEVDLEKGMNARIGELLNK